MTMQLLTLDECRQRLGESASDSVNSDSGLHQSEISIGVAPALARRLRDAGTGEVCITDIATSDGRALCWLDTDHARGWLASAMPAAGTWQAFAGHLATASASGFIGADAAVLAMMQTHHPEALPLLSWDEEPVHAVVAPAALRPLDLYAIVDSANRLVQVLAAGVKTLQLRIKTPDQPSPEWTAILRAEVQRSVQACEAAGAELFINDHWQISAEAGARGVHLGQEDLLALGTQGRKALQATGMALGVSSHSLWELCRARALAPRYIACGPVWPTLTKAMPWHAQGLDNLSWWCRHARVPVVAIGGILEPDKVLDAARCGADGVCIVRGLGEQPAMVVPALQQALEAGRHAAQTEAPAWPHPSLSPPEATS
jgi:hydroxymethylpyrimidine kinase/phosphomethylpyrimidine kinase/thiamine-phosphate diphosphorylase